MSMFDFDYFHICKDLTEGKSINQSTYKYLLKSRVSYSLTSEVAAYLPLFCHLLLSGVNRVVELVCHVVTRPPVGR